MFCIIPIHDLVNYDSIINIFQPLSESNKVQRYVQGKKYRRNMLALTYHIYHLYSRMIKQVRSVQKVVDFLHSPPAWPMDQIFHSDNFLPSQSFNATRTERAISLLKEAPVFLA